LDRKLDLQVLLPDIIIIIKVMELKMSLPWLVMLVLLLVAQSHGARILGVFPFPARSHLIVHKALMFELARRGHQITVVSAFPENKPISNYTDITVKSDINVLTGGHGKRIAATFHLMQLFIS
jgi:hypothetical protein